MKKIIVLIVFVLLLTGCSVTGKPAYNEKYFTEVKECVRKNINAAKNVRFYEEYTILLIPIKSDNGCSTDFDEEQFDYAFIGVLYNNAEGAYRYFLYSRDKNGKGYDESEFLMNGLTESKDVEVNAILKDLYTNREIFKNGTRDGYDYTTMDFKDFDYDIYNSFNTKLLGEISYTKFEKNPE